MNFIAPDFNIASHNTFLELFPIPFFLMKWRTDEMFSQDNLFFNTVLKRDFAYLEKHLFNNNTLGNELKSALQEFYTTGAPEKLEIVLYDDDLSIKVLCMVLSKFMFEGTEMIFVNVVDISDYEKL